MSTPATPPAKPAQPAPQPAPQSTPDIPAPFDPAADMLALASDQDINFDIPDAAPEPTPPVLEEGDPTAPNTTKPGQEEPPPIPGKGTEEPPPGETGKKADAPPPQDEQPPGDKPPEELEQPFEAPPPKHPKARELREAYEGTKKRVTELETELQTVRRQLQERPEPQPELTKSLEQLKAENARLAQQLQATAYERSPHYQKGYIEPYKQALREAYGMSKEVKITDPQTQEEREGTPQDFDRLLSLPFGQAAALAKQLYGDVTGPIMLQQARNVRSLYERAQNALEEANQNQAKSAQEQQANMSLQMEALRKADDAVVQQYAAYFQPKPEEAEKAAIIQKQLNLYDAISRGNPGLSQDQYLRTVALFRRQAAAFPAVVRELNATKKEIARLQAELDALAESEPGGDGNPSSPEVPGARPANYIPDAHAEIDALAD